MGCNPSTSSSNDPLKIYKTSFGVLTITLQNLHVYSVENKGDQNCNEFFMKLIMSNQEAVSKNVVKSGFKNIEAEFQFSLNSRHLPEGRTLSIQLYEKGSIISTSFAGFSLLDIDFLLKEQYLQSMKVYLNNNNQKVGWAEMKAQFQEYETKIVTLMFDSLTIRKKSGFGAMHCKIKAQIGEQVMYTSTSQDKKDHPASWKGEMLTFYYLKDYHKEGKITVYDGNDVVGSMILNLQTFQQQTETQVQMKEQFHHQSHIAGSLNFIIAKGSTIKQPNFMDSQKKEVSSPQTQNLTFIEDAALSAQQGKTKGVIQNVPVLKN